jgi:hypothetical protein
MAKHMEEHQEDVQEEHELYAKWDTEMKMREEAGSLVMPRDPDDDAWVDYYFPTDE